MTRKPFEYIPVIINTVYNTTSNGMLLVRRTDDEQVAKLYIFESGKWGTIDSNQVKNIAKRIIEDDDQEYALFQDNSEVQINIESTQLVRELIANKTYTIDLVA